jgi:ELWxxDGT repeat protein
VRAGRSTTEYGEDRCCAGTFRVKDIFPGSNPSSPYCFVDVGGTLFFAANDGASGLELWRTDGTEAGTLRVIGHALERTTSLRKVALWEAKEMVHGFDALLVLTGSTASASL